MTAWRDLNGSGLEIHCTAPQAVREVLASLGRTEDIRFSPDGRRLAIAAFNRNTIAVLDIDTGKAAAGNRVALTRVVEIAATCLRRPHGLDFIDDETLIVASRAGDVAIFRLPPGEIDGLSCELAPLRVLRAGEAHLLRSPGSVCVSSCDQRFKEVLICDNLANQVTRHILDRGDHCAISSGEVMLRKWLDVPDGVTASQDRHWIAISNHNTNSVLLYQNSPSLTPSVDPDGVLRCVHYPHGLRFSTDDRHIFLADAGAPYVHVYSRDEQGWCGLRNPVASIRVMDDELFRKGRNNPQEGGPKGLDIHGGMNLLAVTSECQPLAFFDLAPILAFASSGPVPPPIDASGAEGVTAGDPRVDPQLREASRRELQALQVRCELDLAEQSRQMLLRAQAKAARAKAKVAVMKNSVSWRMTAPLRRLYAVLRRSS